jgi:hypothetical protein
VRSFTVWGINLERIRQDAGPAYFKRQLHSELSRSGLRPSRLHTEDGSYPSSSAFITAARLPLTTT